MDFIPYVLGGGAVLVFVLYWISYFMHPTWSGSRSFVIDAPLEQVWRAVTDVTVMSEWRRDIAKIEIDKNADGKQRWVQHPNEGPSSTFVEISRTPMSLYETQMLSNGVLSADWIFGFSEGKGGIKVDVVCTLSITHAYYKFMSSGIFQSIEKMFDTNLDHYKSDLEDFMVRGA